MYMLYVIYMIYIYILNILYNIHTHIYSDCVRAERSVCMHTFLFVYTFVRACIRTDVITTRNLHTHTHTQPKVLIHTNHQHRNQQHPHLNGHERENSRYEPQLHYFGQHGMVVGLF
jgi:hypothetical protein